MDIFGATVCGPAHLANGLPNQDAWARSRAGSAQVVVVSDGMGSRPHSRRGARAACRAVVEAVRQWRRYPDASVDILLGLIHLLWRARIAPLSLEDCACTCLFAVLEPDGSGIIAQLGDGLVVLREGVDVYTLSGRSEDDFSNETGTLADIRLSRWRKIELGRLARTVVLCTDGVADDLLPDRLGSFIDWLITDVRAGEPAKRRRILERALRNWPTPKHLDDKTIAVIHISESGS